MGKDFDEPIVQYVMRGIFIARIAVAYRKQGQRIFLVGKLSFKRIA